MNSLIGNRFGKWTVIFEWTISKQGKARYFCLCECNRSNVVFASNLIRNLSKSCGCEKPIMRKYGGLRRMYKAEHSAWYNMITRCTKQHSPEYKNYGARGIKVCERWLVSFPNFLADMGPKPSADLTLDRIDNNGNYESENCRWATKSEQSFNKRQHKLTLDDAIEIVNLRKQKMNVKQIAERFNIHSTMVYLIEHGKAWPKAHENKTSSEITRKKYD